MRNTIVVSMLVAALVVPVYAHHGGEFLTKALETNTAEVRMAELASMKAESPRVKEYAQMIVKDHNMTIDRINQLRDARLADSAAASGSNLSDRTLKNAANVTLSIQHQKTLDRLGTLSGSTFDIEFMDIMVREHRLAIHDFEAQTRVHPNEGTSKTPTAPNATREKPADQKYSHVDFTRDKDTADFARETLPTLKQHLDMGQMIQMGMGQKK